MSRHRKKKQASEWRLIALFAVVGVILLIIMALAD